MSGAAKLTRALLFPPKCVSCRERLPFDSDLPLCKTCLCDWEQETVELCGICQRPVCECTCSTPRMKNAGVSTLFKLAYYKAGGNHSPNKLLFRMKETAGTRLYSFVAKALAKRILSYLQEKKIPLSDCLLTYAPRHRRALLRAGMDQAERLAEELSKELEIPNRTLLTRKRGNNRVQKRLNAAERFKNAQAAFATRPLTELSDKTILLVDDTVTTGATMAVCAKLIKDAGAAKVIGVAVTLDEIGRYPREESLSTKPYS